MCLDLHAAPWYALNSLNSLATAETARDELTVGRAIKTSVK
jgi:hypothetical protein